MPSKQKILLFCSGFFLSIGSFAVICTCLGTQSWVSGNIYYNGTFHGHAVVSYGLFQAKHEKKGGLDTQLITLEVLQLLDASVSLQAIHILVILFLVVGLLASFMGSVTTCLNSVSNPYLTFLGPLGVYVWSSISCGFVLLGMIFFASNTELNDMPSYIANVLDGSDDEYYRNENTYEYSFWLLLLTIFLNIATVGVIYYYQYTRYIKKKAQERPMENASGDVILF